MIVIILGLPGSGKTYFAGKLALKIGGLHISSDTVRKHMQQINKYNEQAKLEVYDEMLKLTEKAISSNQNVVLDGTFYKENIRNMFKEEATLLNSSVSFIEIRANRSVIKDRLKMRKESEADFKVYLKIKSLFEALPEKHLILYSDKGTLDEMQDKTLAYINYPDGKVADSKAN